MSDDGKVSYKPSPHITMDSSLSDLMVDRGVPSSTAAGSRDPEPHPPEPPPPESVPKASSSSSPPAKPAAPKPKPKAPGTPSGDVPVSPPAVLPPPVVDVEAAADDEAEDEEPLSREQRLQKEANSIEHQMSHIPKNPTCPICQRSRRYKKRVNKLRTDPLEDRGSLDPVHKFNERIAADFIIVRKLKSGRENAVQVI